MNGTIYYIRNEITGQGYVGQTIQPGNKRFRDHVWGAKSTGYPKRLIDQVIAEVGEDCIHYEVLETGIDSYEKLNEREVYWIERLDTLWPNGYNRTTGGRNNCHCAARLVVDAEIVSLYESGLTIDKVAEIKKCSATKVRNHLLSAGVTIRPRKGRKYPDRVSPRRKFKLSREEVVQLILSGKTYSQIAEIAGVAPGSMKKIMRQLGTRYCDLFN